ncbi:MAG: hypothetical protein ACM3UR_15970 [Bacteroidota bacterium]|nr:hypothetical protein [Ignavibacteria bacterium]MCU7519895.1 hypothetical protein [Ignavibacteria bacterium]MCU7526034.1 hypothetical protein [Ignavibacteria bacterium]
MMFTREDDAGMLRKIEAAVIAVFKQNPWMVDYTVINALEAAIKHYRTEQYDTRESITELSQSEEAVYKGIRSVCDLQVKQEASHEIDITESSGRIVLLLKTMLSSIEKADRGSDPQNYLKSVSKT